MMWEVSAAGHLPPGFHHTGAEDELKPLPMDAFRVLCAKGEVSFLLSSTKEK